MNCLAVDDEPLALDIITAFCDKIPFITNLTTCTSGVEAIGILEQNHIDLLFLDINMPHITGLELASLLRNPPITIFTTAYQDHALEGFNLSATDYLVKPFSFERFLKATSRAYELHSLRNTAHHPADDYIIVKVDSANVKLAFDDIIFVEALKDYIKIYTPQKNYVTKSTMKNVTERLPASSFMRIHKSYIVNINRIESFENNHVKISGHNIPLGGGYKDEFTSFIDSKKL
ncbi:MAG: LytTR family DNA-binding domain-containing protein [Rikenellaceae bacterium]|nr:LytTR family DNA-binding domain-containing protein [Rikenellaceae bacterium]